MTSHLNAEQNLIVATEVDESQTPLLQDEGCSAPSYYNDASTTEKLGTVMLTTGANDYVASNKNSLNKLGKTVYRTAQEKAEQERVSATASKSQSLAVAYYTSVKEILTCVGIREPQGLIVMLIITALALPFWLVCKIVWGFKTVSITVGSSLNDIFTAVFGTPMRTDENGNIINGTDGFNLFGKVVFCTLFSIALLGVLFLLVKAFTGFDIFAWFRGA